MNKDKKVDVLTVFTNKYDVNNLDSLEDGGFSEEGSVLMKNKVTNVGEKSLGKWIVLTSVAIVAVVLFTVLANI